MLRQIWLMRHGEAADPDTACSDAERALTARGQGQVAAMARWLAGRGAAPDLILHSPLRRARETAESFAAQFPTGVPLAEEVVLAPGMQPAALWHVLQRFELNCVVCVGHQPDIGGCATTWIGGGGLAFRPGTLAMLSVAAAEPATPSGTLQGLLDPKWFTGG
uniref:Phosphohistidine phosphatase SixA n=1 Tax=Schlesneria paludicola TaxID=360056 RepID=A0A7C4QTQ6_9PLAN